MRPTNRRYLRTRCGLIDCRRINSTMNGFLFLYLDGIDERLLEYLDAEEELAFDIVHRLRVYATDLLAGLVSPRQVRNDWPDWFPLAGAYVATYGTAELAALDEAASFVEALDYEGEVNLSEADRVFLRELELQLDQYAEIRRG